MKLVTKKKCLAPKKADAAKKTAVALKTLTMDPNDAAARTDVVKVTARTARKTLK